MFVQIAFMIQNSPFYHIAARGEFHAIEINSTASKVSVLQDFLVRIFPHLD